MTGRLAGKVAVITGATSGIGRRTAEVFVDEGAAVVVTGRREDEGKRLVKQLGERAPFVRADVILPFLGRQTSRHVIAADERRQAANLYASTPCSRTLHRRTDS